MNRERQGREEREEQYVCVCVRESESARVTNRANGSCLMSMIDKEERSVCMCVCACVCVCV